MSDIDFEKEHGVRVIVHKYSGIRHTDVDGSLVISDTDALVNLKCKRYRKNYKNTVKRPDTVRRAIERAVSLQYLIFVVFLLNF